MKVEIPTWAKLVQKPTPNDPTEKQHFFTPGLSLSFIEFYDKKIGPFSEWATTGKLAYTYRPATPDIDLGLSSYVTIQPFASTSDALAYFWGVNARAGYNTKWLSTPWRFSLHLGAYYLTMYNVGEPSFGFENVGGPQLYPTIRYQFSHTQFAAAYLKFSPVNQQFYKVQDLNNREIAAGGQYSIIRKEGDLVSITLDYSDLSLNLIDDTGVARPQTVNTISVGASYTF